MKEFEIISGAFAKSGTGNYSGYDEDGKRIHIPAHVLESAGLEADENDQLALPFVVLAEEVAINTEDEEGVVVVNKRMTARRAFATEAEFLVSRIRKNRLTNRVAQVLNATTAKSKALSQKELDALLAQAV